MSFEVFTTPHFEKEAKALAKRHRSLKADLGELIKVLAANPLQGIELTPGIRKIRMAITSKQRGKSGGARVITYNIIASETDGRVYLIDIYDKSDYSTADIGVLRSLVEAIKG